MRAWQFYGLSAVILAAPHISSKAAAGAAVGCVLGSWLWGWIEP